ncbi:hypothetical protein [Arthrobacter sp. B3I4]|uniref:hypothetical protein n=1 Tax=Arthrobacter sp. B3I4 TaxID=3042267 RepID=UPI0027870D47|nr:hypothetical protein [Arthrobacter sp. B3I4]MDQ0757112.1 hypothetical protein [Arthrobacter sp. B3I4]
MAQGRTTGTARVPERIAYAAGVGFVVLGGLVAAVAGPLQFERGSWLAAYLVLVCGVAQCAISSQRRVLRTAPLRPATLWMLFGCWNIGNALVIAGSLATIPVITDAGGILLVAGLVLAGAGTRQAQRPVAAVLLRIFYVVLAVSIPVGLYLSYLRAT